MFMFGLTKELIGMFRRRKRGKETKLEREEVIATSPEGLQEAINNCLLQLQIQAKDKIIDDTKTFKLYIKGLHNYIRVGNKKTVAIAAIGAALCDPQDNLILDVQKPLVGDWGQGHLLLKVELNALIEGLNAACSLQIKKIDVICNFCANFDSITMRLLFKDEKIRTLVDQVCLLQQKFDSYRPVLYLIGEDIKFAFRLAQDEIDSQITRSAESCCAMNLKETCSICLEDIDVGQMFVVDGCLHCYCQSCLRKHVEAKLRLGMVMVPRCPHEGCKTELDIPICKKLVSPEWIDIMNQRIKESSIHVTKRLYCPYPRCSELMSKSEVLRYNGSALSHPAIRECIKCHGLFCIECKVPWHLNMSCTEYKSLYPDRNAQDAMLKALATDRSWRQCQNCNHMVELARGCYHITCRCGHEFCYTCGAIWHNKKATCNCRIWDERNTINNQRRHR